MSGKGGAQALLVADEQGVAHGLRALSFENDLRVLTQLLPDLALLVRPGFTVLRLMESGLAEGGEESAFQMSIMLWQNLWSA